MIKEKTVKIKIHSPKQYNLSNINSGDVIDLDVNKLTKGSHVKITAICDICGNEKETLYKSYLKMTKKDGLYYCVKCRKIKTKNSNLEKYGVENVMQLDETKEKMYKTNKERYGHICSAQSDEIKEKSKKTCLEKYGVDNFLKTKEMRDKVKKTNLERYGVENVMQVKKIYEKQEHTMLKKYGVKNISELYKIKEETNFMIYKRNANRLTKRKLKQLYNLWDGFDYYDGEYIAENLLLESNSNIFPTVDHKISIYYGFKNNIPENEISYVNNLCITKRKINSSKNKKTLEEFSKTNNYNMRTKIICILDRSPSMSSIIDEAISGFNIFIDDQKKIEGSEQDMMKIIQFETSCETVFENTINCVEHFNKETYKPQGYGTALYDAIGLTIDEELDFLAESPKNRVDKTLCVILTDGEENSSNQYHQSLIKRKIEEMEKEFSWNFIFLAANQDAVFTANNIGISSGSAMNFNADGEGVRQVYQQMSKATSYYRTTNQEDYSDIMKDSE